jgi:putative tricarboxylic transport membrane protein
VKSRFGLRGRGELGFAALLAVVAGDILIETPSIRVPNTGSGLGPRAFPYMIGIAMAVVAVWLAVEVIRYGSGRPESGEDVDLTKPTDWRTLLLLIGVLLLHIVLLERVGYIISAALLFGGAAFVLGARKPIPLLLSTVALPIVIYVAFTRGLDLSLPGGPLESVL